MGRQPCCSKSEGLKRGQWTTREDALLTKYIQTHGEGSWRSLPKKAGLFRCGKSCRLRWMNYLRPGIKRGNFSFEEDDLIIRLHSLLGNKWSLMATRLPCRTDNEIKNYWNTHLRTKVQTIDSPAESSNEPSSKSKRKKSTKDKLAHKIHCPKVSTFSSTRNKSIPIIDNDTPKSTFSKSSISKRENDSQAHDLAPSLDFDLSDIDTEYTTYRREFMVYDDFNYGLESSCMDIHTNDDDMLLEKMFEEYQQLIHADVRG